MYSSFTTTEANVFIWLWNRIELCAWKICNTPILIRIHAFVIHFLFDDVYGTQINTFLQKRIRDQEKTKINFDFNLRILTFFSDSLWLKPKFWEKVRIVSLKSKFLFNFFSGPNPLAHIPISRNQLNLFRNMILKFSVLRFKWQQVFIFLILHLWTTKIQTCYR